MESERTMPRGYLLRRAVCTSSTPAPTMLHADRAIAVLIVTVQKSVMHADRRGIHHKGRDRSHHRQPRQYKSRCQNVARVTYAQSAEKDPEPT